MTQSEARHIFVGDVHGCLDELTLLLKEVRFGADDVLVLVGDLVAKGPDSAGVVALAREYRARSVCGNHDEAVLRHIRAVRAGEPLPHLKKQHARVAQALSPADWDYLLAMPLWLRFDALGVAVVHAGVLPDVPLEAQDPRNLITMRTIRPDGTASPKLSEGALWATRYTGPPHLVFGHDAITGLQLHAHATGLDTGCVYGGALTALLMPERRVVSVPATRVHHEAKP